jgi:protein-S-isoprenylcysteine O-methyltransferase Ste14
MMENRIERAVYRWRVRAAVVFIPIVILLSGPSVKLLLVGIAVCLLGLGIRAWASGHLKKEKELATSGPYRYCRNPLYLGNLILGLGITLGSRSWWVFLIFIAHFLIFYPLVIKKEQTRMKELFPGEYDEYRRRVPMFFPSLRQPVGGRKSRFSWALYRKNKEPRALIGTLVFWLILLAKILLAGH